MDINEAAVLGDALFQVSLQSMETPVQPWEVTADGLAWHVVSVVEPHRVFYQVQQMTLNEDWRSVGKPTQDYPRALASAQTRATRSVLRHRIIEFVAKAPSPSEDTTEEETAP